MTGLVQVQQPGSLAEVGAQCDVIEEWADECDDISALRDATNKLAAIDEYLTRTSIDGRARVAATMRRLEVRIGDVLGPPQRGRPSEPNPHHDEDFHDQQLSDFRKMAEHPDEVEDVIAKSNDDDPPSRRKVMRAINKPKLNNDGISHPARYTSDLIPLFADLLRAYSFPGAHVLDPFAGTGRIHELHPEFDTVGIELEKEWSDLHERTQQGNALDLPFDPETFDAIVTSPTYGNRLADSHNASDPERRRSYTHDLGRDLGDDNSGVLHWRTTAPGAGAMGSSDYRNFHEKAWDEAVLVLRPGGLFILNMCDHVRDGLVQPVTAWHCWLLGRLGLDWMESRSIPTRKLRQGANADLREQEQVHVLRKPS
jgi:SAM-dependent methyltransferase